MADFEDLAMRIYSWGFQSGWDVDQEERPSRLRFIFRAGKLHFFIVVSETPFIITSDNADYRAAIDEALDSLPPGSATESTLSAAAQSLKRFIQEGPRLSSQTKPKPQAVAPLPVAHTAASSDGKQRVEIESISQHAGWSQATQDFSGSGTAAASTILTKQFTHCMGLGGEYGFAVDLIDDNLYLWQVLFAGFDEKSHLGRDLKEYAARYGRPPVIELQMLFPKDFPHSPPFLRVIRPRFKVISICTQALTRSGWLPSVSLENILVQIRAEICGDPNAQLDKSHADKPYDEVEARKAFDRMCQRYGWKP